MQHQLKLWRKNEVPVAPLFGLTGHAESGKTSFAEQARLIDGEVKIRSVGYQIKKKAAAFADVPLQEIFDNKKFYRPLLVDLAAAGRRQFGKNYWVNKLVKNIGNLQDETILFIDDVRTNEDAAWVRAEGGYIININRVGQIVPPYDERDETERPEDIEADYIYWNDPSEPKLLEKAVEEIIWGDVIAKAEQKTLVASAS